MSRHIPNAVQSPMVIDALRDGADAYALETYLEASQTCLEEIQTAAMSLLMASTHLCNRLESVSIVDSDEHQLARRHREQDRKTFLEIIDRIAWITWDLSSPGLLRSALQTARATGEAATSTLDAAAE